MVLNIYYISRLQTLRLAFDVSLLETRGWRGRDLISSFWARSKNSGLGILPSQVNVKDTLALGQSADKTVCPSSVSSRAYSGCAPVTTREFPRIVLELFIGFMSSPESPSPVLPGAIGCNNRLQSTTRDMAATCISHNYRRLQLPHNSSSYDTNHRTIERFAPW